MSNVELAQCGKGHVCHVCGEVLSNKLQLSFSHQSQVIKAWCFKCNEFVKYTEEVNVTVVINDNIAKIIDRSD